MVGLTVTCAVMQVTGMSLVRVTSHLQWRTMMLTQPHSSSRGCNASRNGGVMGVQEFSEHHEVTTRLRISHQRPGRHSASSTTLFLNCLVSNGAVCGMLQGERGAVRGFGSPECVGFPTAVGRCCS